MGSQSDASAFYSNEKWHPAVRISRIKLHPDVFRAYTELYTMTSVMCARMDDVLDHPEHRMIMAEAGEQGFSMPDIEGVRARNHVLKVYLSATNPTDGIIGRDGLIDIPVRTARNLHLIAFQSALMIDDVCRNIRESDYMLWFRTLRNLDIPYIGPTSLQEVFNVWGSLSLCMVRQAQHAPPLRARLPGNWLQLVA